ncbi:DNA replication and repair protein RecN [Nitrosococcus oceani ATCC 19707]|uniref:DNA repair protein RecN n=2 Tax=Nitrosococcus oceani TaxID=1229 RepID=Q3JBV3_NITOC|nr:DNA repair protein RecN [Nitrosococcus oceani]ABA57693.1 DNA replication and repair protein RecN [Nitrosococcus oceani ATCC 19707]EDZ68485.1 DNA repair protein RecN [Nitrosococcus oceani AFC27]KFI19862.1 DNA recombination protein RecN [Nitrosococcus oceani C-27]GEM19343.1 DNA repair protein RecN [Nitrosococcus oceani]
MIRELLVRDLAIITELVLPLETGMTALTGETGAGKSILVDALGLVLGDRGDVNLIRHGQERAEVSAIFELGANRALLTWLQARDLEQDEECVLRRILSREGRSRAYINGRPVPIQTLREVGRQLVDIYGQHAHQSLLRPGVQRSLLDAYGAHTLLFDEWDRAYRHWRQLSQALETLTQTAGEQAARLELLRYQVEELEAFRAEPGELARLEQEQQQLAHGAELVQGVELALDLLYQNEQGAIYALLGKVSRQLAQLGAIDPKLTPLVELLENAAIQIDEAVGGLRHYLDSMDIDPERLRWVEERLSGFYDLARKHRIAPAELPTLAEHLASELRQMESVDNRLGNLQGEFATALQTCRALAADLSKARASAAVKLAQGVTEVMQSLAMPGGCFKVILASLKEQEFSAHGAEQVQFQVSANPGQPPGPLSKVASGGELSRIGLAIQVLTSQWGGVSALIFDEVDVGIGGAVAETVGARLRELAKYRQVLCVTHLPQVAAQAHAQIRISKSYQKKTAIVELTCLDEKERVEEIARMLGGREITERSRAHAHEMLEMVRRIE